MHFDGKMKNNRRKIERGLGILPYGNSHAYTIGKCGEALYFKEFEIQCFCVLTGVNGLMLFFNRISC